MDYESLLELVQKRRSIRKFKPEPIPDEYVDKIIEVARWAPSGANSQPWEFIIVKKQELKEKIVDFIDEQNKLRHKIELVRPLEMRVRWSPGGYGQAPVLIILGGDTRTTDTFPLDSKIRRGHGIFNSSLANAFLYMNLAVVTLGLGAQWVSRITDPYVQTYTKELLGVPGEIEFYDMLAVGYPDSEPRPRLIRAREEMVHYDYYEKTKYRTDQDIRDFIIKLRVR